MSAIWHPPGRRGGLASPCPLLFSLTLALVPAQAADAPNEPTLYEHVVVTANRVEQKFDDVAGNVTVFTREEIDPSAARTLDDFLRQQLPGFSLFRRSSSLVAHPTAQGVTLRGISPSGVSRTLVLLDGVPANDAFGGWVYWSRIPLESVERIEILRGGGSNVWGNYALGGVVNITTRGVAGRALAAAATVGSQNDLELDLHGGRRHERFGWSLDGSYFRTDGYEIIREDQRGAIDIRAFSDRLYLSPKLEYDLSPGARLFFHASYFTEDRGNGTPLTNNDTVAGQFDAGSEFSTAGGSDWRVAIFARDQTFASSFSAQEPDRSNERPALDQFAVDSSDVGAGAQWTKRIAERHLLTAGTDLHWIDGQTNEDFFWDGTAFLRERHAGGEQRLAGLFVQDLLIASTDLELTLSARFDYWTNADGFRLEQSRTDGSVLRSDTFEDRNESATSPKLAAIYKATESIALRGSVYRSFRGPTINELYRPFRVRNDITEANAELRPETLTGAEFGLNFSRPKTISRLTAFWNRVDDPIANVTIDEADNPAVIDPCGFVPAGGSCRQRHNLGETRIVGFEAEITAHPAEAWDVSARYLYSDGEVIDAPAQPALEGLRIAQVPEHQLTVGLGYDNPRLVGARIQTRYAGAQFEDDLNTRQLSDYLVVDLSLRKEIGKDLELLLGAENLFDETVEAGKSGDGLVTVGAPRRVHLTARLRLGP